MENRSQTTAAIWQAEEDQSQPLLPIGLNFNAFEDRLRCLYSLVVSPAKSFQAQCRAYLQIGCKMFNAQYGMLVQYGSERVRYYKFTAATGNLDKSEALREELPLLTQDQDVKTQKNHLGATQTDVNLSSLAYNGEAITRYLGNQVTVLGDKFGELSFFSVGNSASEAISEGGSEKNRASDPHNTETIELMAKGVARMIELQTVQTNKAPSVELGAFATPGVKSLDEYIHQARLPEVIGIPGKVVEVLQRRIGHAPLSIDHIAEELNLSKRTLQRRLQQQNLNFAHLRDQVRFHFSIDYLIEQHMSIDSISGSLDFSDRTSFTNAFKRWTGLSPSTFRKLFRDYN